MLNGDVKSLIARGDYLFSNRGNILSFWQDAAENFMPERATFLATQTVGEDFASNLYTSYPIIVRRELAGAFSSMLRRRDTQWGKISVARQERLDQAGREWLEYATKIMWRAMYDRQANFVRSTTMGDNDFTTFGQTVITRDINWKSTAMLFRTWHLGNCAWGEDATGQVNELHIQWEPTLDQLVDAFGAERLHEKMVERYKKTPYLCARIRMVYVPSEYYQAAARAEGQKAWKTRKPYTVLYIDMDNQHVIAESGRRNKGFCLPRWVTIPHSTIAYSPAVIAALPDARLIQAMTLTMLEAGEGAVRPPLLGIQDIIRGDANVFPGGITWANMADAGDRQLDQVLRPLFQEKGALPIGLEMVQDTRDMLAAAFFLNKLTLPNPERAGKMTAFEIAERLKEWIRSAIPLFEPVETEYNADLCEGIFDDLMGVNAFGPPEEIPQSLQGAEVEFQFQSPLHDNIERQKAHTFLEAKSLIVAAAELDRAALGSMDARGALHDALLAVGMDPKYVRDKKDVDEYARQLEESTETAEMAAMAEQGGKAVKAVAEGAAAMEGA